MKSRKLSLDMLEALGGTFNASAMSLNKYDENNSNGIYKKQEKLIFMNFALSQLTDKQKNCYLKYYMEKSRIIDIAKEMGIKQTTVYKHIKKAKMKIADLSESLQTNGRLDILITKFKKALKCLPEDERMIIKEYYIQNKSCPLIAKETGTDRSEVYYLHRVAKRRLKSYNIDEIDLTRLHKYFKKINADQSNITV